MTDKITEEMLRDLHLPEKETERLLAAYRSETERADRAEKALSDSLAKEKGRLLCHALQEVGLNGDAARLLAEQVDRESLHVEDGSLSNRQAVVEKLRVEWPGLFPAAKPVATIAPPVSPSGGLTREAIAAMSADEINRSWPYVRAALQAQQA